MNAKDIEQAIIDLEDFEINDKVVLENPVITVLGLVVGFTKRENAVFREAEEVWVIFQPFTLTGPNIVVHPHALRSISHHQRLSVTRNPYK